MYLEYYGLTRQPFQITPDVAFFYDSRVHKRALATIIYGLSKKEGFVVVTGDVGSGKTTLIEYLLTSGNPRDVVIARVSTTQLEADSLLELIAAELEVPKPWNGKAELLRALNSYLLKTARGGRSVLLIVDEVQNLSREGLEELRMLSNFQSAEKPLVQMLLVGQPEFRDRLASPECEQIRQRVITSYHLAPLPKMDVPVYIEHRLRQAGHDGPVLFTRHAYRRIYDESGGVPRKINRLCDRLLLYGYLEERGQLDAAAVDAVVAEMREESISDPIEPSDPPDTPARDGGQTEAPAGAGASTGDAPASGTSESAQSDFTATAPHEPEPSNKAESPPTRDANAANGVAVDRAPPSAVRINGYPQPGEGYAALRQTLNDLRDEIDGFKVELDRAMRRVAQTRKR